MEWALQGTPDAMKESHTITAFPGALPCAVAREVKLTAKSAWVQPAVKPDASQPCWMKVPVPGKKPPRKANLKH